MISRTLQALCAPTFEMLKSVDGMKNNPDVVDDLYRLAQKFVSFTSDFVTVIVIIIVVIISSFIKSRDLRV